MEKITRNYLQIKSIDQLKIKNKPIGNFYIKEDKKKDFQLNKFFYKQIGKNHHWIDRLSWSENHWIEYISNPRLEILCNDFNNELIISSSLPSNL